MFYEGINIRPWTEFDFESFKALPVQKKKRGNPGTRSKIRYKDIVTAFDIETSRITDIEQSVMYIWQWAFGDSECYIGRTWEEFLLFAHELADCLGESEHLFCAVHNLSYEFQFLQGVYKFYPDDVFCMDSRKILSCKLYGHIDMKCSYLHSNMSLKEYTEKMGAPHSKLSGKDFNYEKIRYPWTELSTDELAYCVYDVIGLVEALQIEMQHDGDNLYSLPATSTGYVRRRFKRVMKHVSHYWVHRQLPTPHVYDMLRKGFRGGNTHANRWYAGTIVQNVNQVDISSDYPDKLCNRPFPCDRFYEVGAISARQFHELYKVMKRAIIMKVTFYNIRMRDQWMGCPYVSRDKCEVLEDGAYDNGRVLSAAVLTTYMTDIDYSIMEEQYIWDDVTYDDVAYTRYGMLPEPIVDLICDLYKQKTALKGIASEDGSAELNYYRTKALLNSVYGMMVTAIKDKMIYDHGEYHLEGKPIEELLEKDNLNRQLPPYQIGVWCTAWARRELMDGINLVENTPGAHYIYCDTDSVKYTGDVDWTKINNKNMKASKRSGAYATDAKGKKHYMGVWEDEGIAVRFCSLGAKKYCYEDEHGRLHLTVSGVIKRDGAIELEKHGGIEAFKPSFVFTEAGGVEAIYNDDPEIKEYNVDGHVLHITPNVVLRPSTYTLGITDEYERLLSICKLDSDIF